MRKKYSTYIAVVLSFLLGSHQGYIALWKDGEADPIKVFPYRVASLPAEDQKRLEDGIHLENKKELLELVEDYLS